MYNLVKLGPTFSCNMPQVLIRWPFYISILFLQPKIGDKTTSNHIRCLDLLRGSWERHNFELGWWVSFKQASVSTPSSHPLMTTRFRRQAEAGKTPPSHLILYSYSPSLLISYTPSSPPLLSPPPSPPPLTQEVHKGKIAPVPPHSPSHPSRTPNLLRPLLLQQEAPSFLSPESIIPWGWGFGWAQRLIECWITLSRTLSYCCCGWEEDRHKWSLNFNVLNDSERETAEYGLVSIKALRLLSSKPWRNTCKCCGHIIPFLSPEWHITQFMFISFFSRLKWNIYVLSCL